MTLAEAQQLRAAWLAAELAVATGKSYTIGHRTLTRADEHFIHEQFSYYDRIVDELTRTGGQREGIPVFRVIPRDL